MSSIIKKQSTTFHYLSLLVFLLLCTVNVQAATDCAVQTEIPQAECEDLITLYDSTGGANWRDNAGWKQTNTPCSWDGITCSEGNITRIDLPRNELAGNIPNFTALTNLITLDLNSNQLTGSIPNFSALTNLQYLWLYNNQLTSIPDLSALTNLQELILHDNQLAGSIPNLSTLTNLQRLYLKRNQLTGSIPTELGNLTNLQSLSLENNQLIGSIPDFSALTNLQYLWLDNNQLCTDATINYSPWEEEVNIYPICASNQASISISPTNHTFNDTPVINSSTRKRSSINNISPKKAEYWPNRVIVKFRNDTQSTRRRSLRSRLNAELIKDLSLINAEVWQVDDVEAIIANQTRNAHPEIEYIEPDYVIHLDRTPNDPSFDELWGLHNTGQSWGTTDADIDAEEAWDITTGNNSVLCAVIDTGIDYNHPDLVANMWTNPGEIPNNGIDDDGNGYVDDVHGYDFANNDGDPFDDGGHGTHVMGTIAGVGNNSVGVTGINWSAQIMALKFMKPDWLGRSSGKTSDAILAIQYAIQMGARCTNNSWGGGGYEQALYDAIEAAGNAGQLFMAAAGNKGRDTDNSPHYPSSYDLDNIISVCSTNHNDELSSFSNIGQQNVDLCAPGSRIYSTVPNNGYTTYNGTSMATPHVTGAVMLLWSAFPHLTTTEVKTYIMASAERIPNLSGTNVTAGRLNAHHALTMSEQTPQQTFTITSTGDADLVISQVRLTGTNAIDFQIRNDQCSAQTLAPNNTCTVDVHFTPTSTGNKQASLEISSNAASTATASLTGDAVSVASVDNTLSIEWAEQSDYQINTGDVNIPSVLVGSDMFSAKLCQIGNSLRFRLCDLAEANVNSRLGDTSYDANTGIVTIPTIEVEGLSVTDSTDITINSQSYEVDMQAITLPDGNLEFEVIELIPIW